jgi:hypothetical protein
LVLAARTVEPPATSAGAARIKANAQFLIVLLNGPAGLVHRRRAERNARRLRQALFPPPMSHRIYRSSEPSFLPWGDFTYETIKVNECQSGAVPNGAYLHCNSGMTAVLTRFPLSLELEDSSPRRTNSTHSAHRFEGAGTGLRRARSLRAVSTAPPGMARARRR